jgi:predicted small lipoprotein YifL
LFLSRLFDRTFLRLALAAALAASLGLMACGRKGPLDPPPGASLTGQPQPSMPGVMNTEPATQNGQAKAGQQAAPKGPQKQFLLDGLLN